MSCGCNTPTETCSSCTPCGCCPPAPPLPLPVCANPEPCDVALDSQCVMYTGDSLSNIKVPGGGETPVRMSDVLAYINMSLYGWNGRAGENGIQSPIWTTTGWVRTVAAGGDFILGAKYVIYAFVTGDNFSNISSNVIQGSINTTGCVFIATAATTATVWSNGSTIVKVGRPAYPLLGEMGYNLTDNKLEYWNGTIWVQL